MKRLDCMRALAPLLTEELVVVALGGTADEWFSVRQAESTVVPACMGANLPLAIGLSLVLPHRRVVLLDSDGSQLMTMGALATLGNVQPANLRVFVFDNEGYAYTGGQASATRGRTDLAAVARAVGIDAAATVHDLEAFKTAASQTLAHDGLSYVVAKVEMLRGVPPDSGPNRQEHTIRFIRYIESTEGVKILGTP
jgi:sulfopyruvate decarboxylase subunit beta